MLFSKIMGGKQHKLVEKGSQLGMKRDESKGVKSVMKTERLK